MFFSKAICVIVTFFLSLGGMISGTYFDDTAESYIANIESIDVYTNTMETASPQTKVYDMIKAHYDAPLAQGKTEKKAIVIGYDGCRADALKLLSDNADGAISYLLATGGEVELAYCGGANYPSLNKQKTKTAPGWCSMLTGVWADEHGVTANGIIKSNDKLTLLTTLVEDGTIDDSAFYVSWDGHFVNLNSTYIKEKEYIAEKGLDVTFLDASDDAGTVSNILADVNSTDCSDFIFLTLEHTDHAGHDTGFSINNPVYAESFALAEADGKTIINAIEARETYAQEDWLIIVTTDHGGFCTEHGSLTLQERITFIAAR
ncbi:MAG: alkaline phosphatase family protein [Clostridia bacterium]|nr:alkaline phosphatase family protein [Clostridia bacterium]